MSSQRPCPVCGTIRWADSAEVPCGPCQADAQVMSPEEVKRLSDLADAACPRFILILHPNFKLPEGFHLGAAAHDKHGRHAHGRTA